MKNRPPRFSIFNKFPHAVLACTVLLYAQTSLAQGFNPTPDQLAKYSKLSDTQKKALALKFDGNISSHSSNAANTDSNNYPTEIATAPIVVPAKPLPPSAIEISMRARISSGLKSSVKDNQDGGHSEQQSGLGNADLIKASADEKNHLDSSRKQDLDLRSSWERFLVDAKVRSVDNDFSQFGYQLFSASSGTMLPATDIPVPPEYVVGPGDELQMQLYGSSDDTLSLVVDRNGTLEIPKVGPLAVAGMTFIQARALIAEQLNKKMIGVTASITMGKLRSIRVFVLGEAQNPGSYLISGLSTISYALLNSGGISKTGSLRHIQLKRGGRIVRELDLYDFLLKGNSTADERVMPGDVIFIPPIGPVVGVAGHVTRPGIYELRDERSVQDVIKLAGGNMVDADLAHMQIDRLNKNGDRNIVDANFQNPTTVNNGDILMMFSSPNMHADTIDLLGHVKRPGKYGWSKGMKLSALLKSTDDVLPGAFLDYALIERTDTLKRSITTLRVSLNKLLAEKDMGVDVELEPEDNIYVFAKSAIDPLNVVSISGQIVNPGIYPYADTMRLADLLFAAGGPNESSYLKVAELTRYEIIDGQSRDAHHFEVNLGAAIAGDPNANITLQPHDELFIRTISNWKANADFQLVGEINFPGKYSIQEGERLSTVLERAGGYTDKAYLDAAIFTRESVREAQQKQLDDLAQRTETEVARMEVSSTSLKDEILRTRALSKIESAKRIAEQLKAAKATGRVVIQISDIQKLKGSNFDIALQDGDTLTIPQKPDTVAVIGEVYNQTAFIYQDSKNRDDYLRMAGGPTKAGDTDHIYVVRVNGMVDAGDNSWFGNSTSKIAPGDFIVIPEDVAQFNMLDSTLDWSRAMMQVGISLASMKTIGVLK